MRLALLLLLVSSPFAHSAEAVVEKNSRALFDLWAKVKKPLPGETDPIGAYTAGCLAGAEKLPLDGPGYSVMRTKRLRYYGHKSLVSYLKGLGASAKEAGLPLVLVGDLGGPRGGPMRTGHSSHQTGLDVDVWFEMSKKKPSMRDRESWGADPFVNLATNELSAAWGDPQRKLVELAASAQEVARVFVHPAIKRDLCRKSPEAAWLPKVRAWWNHHDHLHARLQCPAGSAQCVAQDPIKPGDNGCGEELAWWFSEEAKEEGRKMALKFTGREFPELPAACQEMVKDFSNHVKKVTKR